MKKLAQISVILVATVHLIEDTVQIVICLSQRIKFKEKFFAIIALHLARKLWQCVAEIQSVQRSVKRLRIFNVDQKVFVNLALQSQIEHTPSWFITVRDPAIKLLKIFIQKSYKFLQKNLNCNCSFIIFYKDLEKF